MHERFAYLFKETNPRARFRHACPSNLIPMSDYALPRYPPYAAHQPVCSRHGGGAGKHVVGERPGPQDHGARERQAHIGEVARGRQFNRQCQSDTRTSRPVLSVITLARQLVGKTVSVRANAEFDAVFQRLKNDPVEII
jgi:hypothetical protein